MDGNELAVLLLAKECADPRLSGLVTVLESHEGDGVDGEAHDLEGMGSAVNCVVVAHTFSCSGSSSIVGAGGAWYLALRAPSRSESFVDSRDVCRGNRRITNDF